MPKPGHLNNMPASGLRQDPRLIERVKQLWGQGKTLDEIDLALR